MNARQVETAINNLTVKGRELFLNIARARGEVTRSELAEMLGKRRLFDHDRALLFELTESGLIEQVKMPRRGQIDYYYVYSVPAPIRAALAEIKAKYAQRKVTT